MEIKNTAYHLGIRCKAIGDNGTFKPMQKLLNNLYFFSVKHSQLLLVYLKGIIILGVKSVEVEFLSASVFLIYIIDILIASAGKTYKN